MVSNKTGAVILGGSVLGLLFLGTRGSETGNEQFFGGGGSGGGFFGGEDESNYTAVQKDPTTTEPSVAEAIASFLTPTPTPSSSSSDGGSYSSKKSNGGSLSSYTAPSGLKIFTDSSGNIVGGEDPSRMMSLSAEGTKKAINSALSNPSTPQFQGPVRPSDNESIFRLTGASTGGSSNRSSSSGGSSSSSSKKSLKTDSLSGKDKGKGSYTVKKSDGSKVKRYFQ